MIVNHKTVRDEISQRHLECFVAEVHHFCSIVYALSYMINCGFSAKTKVCVISVLVTDAVLPY